jgi:hypothetical protein
LPNHDVDAEACPRQGAIGLDDCTFVSRGFNLVCDATGK